MKVSEYLADKLLEIRDVESTGLEHADSHKPGGISDLSGIYGLKSVVDDIAQDVATYKADIAINVESYGIIGNANYFNITTKKWYEDAEFTTEATDFTTEIQALLNNPSGVYKTILFPPGSYLINPARKLIVNSNCKIIFSNGAKLVGVETNNDIYTFLEIVRVENIEIHNPHIFGDREYNTMTTEGAGHGISCRHVKNVKILNAKIENCFTDGMYLNDVTDFEASYITCDNNRRQGISFICGVNVKFDMLTLKNTNGTAPGLGMDIEPNNIDEKLQNIKISNVVSENNSGGGLLINYNALNDMQDIDIEIDNWKDYGSTIGLQISKFINGVKGGRIVINKFKTYNNISAGIAIMHKPTDSAKIVLNEPYVFNPNVGNGVNQRSQDVAISIHDDTTGYPDGVGLGNVEINRPTIEMQTGRSIMRGIYMGFGQILNNVSVIDPLKVDIGDLSSLSANNNRALVGVPATAGCNFSVSDSYEALKIETGSTTVRNYGTGIHSLIISTASNTTITLNEFMLWGILKEFTVIKTGDSAILNINLPATITFYDDEGVVSGVLRSTQINNIVKFIKIKNDVYKIQKIYGNWVIA